MPLPTIRMTHLPTQQSTSATSGEVLQKWARKICIPFPMGATARGVRKLKEMPFGKVYLCELGNMRVEEAFDSVFSLEVVKP